MAHDLLSELRFRGLLHQTTSEDGLRAHLDGGRRTAYVGFDPTADSLTIGNFVSIKLLMHLQRAGHSPVAVIGGGTGLIGDPSGKSAERQLLTAEVVAENVRGQRRIFERLLDFSGPCAARLVNNLDWLGPLGYIEALRDVGKHFSVNVMIQRDAVRDRLHNREQGISYTEFSYILLQAYDYYHLHKELGVTLQMGGSDQWGNIASGCDLIRRMAASRGVEAPEVFGLTSPLITKSDGGKFGKSESGAVWLTADRTSPYALYQFFLNTEDRDVPRFLRIFTFFSQEEVTALEAAHEKEPGARAAHRALARHVTALLHGDEEARHAEAAAEALFSGDIAGLPERTLTEVFASVPSSDHARAELERDGGLPILDALMLTTLAKSKREAREFLQAGSITMNGRRVDAAATVGTADLLHGSLLAFRRGKKAWHLTRWK